MTYHVILEFEDVPARSPKEAVREAILQLDFMRNYSQVTAQVTPENGKSSWVTAAVAPAEAVKKNLVKHEYVVEVLRSFDAYDLVTQCIITANNRREAQECADELALAYTRQEERDPDEMYGQVTPLGKYLRNMRKSGRAVPKFVKQFREEE